MFQRFTRFPDITEFNKVVKNSISLDLSAFSLDKKFFQIVQISQTCGSCGAEFAFTFEVVFEKRNMMIYIFKCDEC